MPRANYDLPEELLEKVIMQRRHVIAVQNEKGGEAKTPYTFHIATALAEAGCKVLCIDLDPQGDLTTTMALYALDLRGQFTANELALANTFTIFDDDASSKIGWSCFKSLPGAHTRTGEMTTTSFSLIVPPSPGTIQPQQPWLPLTS